MLAKTDLISSIYLQFSSEDGSLEEHKGLYSDLRDLRQAPQQKGFELRLLSVFEGIRSGRERVPLRSDG